MSCGATVLLLSLDHTISLPHSQEIINAVKAIQQAVVTAELDDNRLELARVVKGRIETTTLGEVR